MSSLIVIGGGSGGVRAARIAATHGARVVLIEEHKVGGTCVHAGCVPKKLLVYAAQHARALRHAEHYGFAPVSPPPHSWRSLLATVTAETARLGTIYERNLEVAGVTIKRGTAQLIDARSVQLGSEVLRAEHIVIATGARPLIPDIPGKKLGQTSDDVFRMPELPRRVVIVGGGYIALELACLMAPLGAHVTVVQRGPRVLTEHDDDLSKHMAVELPAQGIELVLNAQAIAVEPAVADGAKRVVLDTGAMLECDAVFFATGRVPRSDGLGLERAGVELDEEGAIRTDRYGATNVPGIHAIGDVTRRLQLTPVAIAEGHALADTLFGGMRRSVHDQLVPTAVFCDPEVATVGETERAARARGVVVDIYRANFRPLEHAIDKSPARALVKLVVDRASQRLLGCHIAAPNAAEVIQGFAAAMTAGVTKPQLDETIGLHPTIGEELLTLRRAIPDV